MGGGEGGGSGWEHMYRHGRSMSMYGKTTISCKVKNKNK